MKIYKDKAGQWWAQDKAGMLMPLRQWILDYCALPVLVVIWVVLRWLGSK